MTEEDAPLPVKMLPEIERGRYLRVYNAVLAASDGCVPCAEKAAENAVEQLRKADCGCCGHAKVTD